MLRLISLQTYKTHHHFHLPYHENMSAWLTDTKYDYKVTRGCISIPVKDSKWGQKGRNFNEWV